MAKSAAPRISIPPQHGAWAYLAVPLIIGTALAGVSALGLLFAVTWVLAYPASYYVGRALVVRWRRGSWTRIARREARAAVPWSIAAGIGAVVLAVAEPWLLVVGVALAAAWMVGLILAHAGRERGFANDLLLIAQSLVALPLLWFISADSGAVPAPASVWWATGICGVYFIGSVIHVKSLIREASDTRWRQANIGYHILALSIALYSPWLLVPFGAALVRSVALRAPVKPALVGGIEAGVSVLVVVATLLAVR